MEQHVLEVAVPEMVHYRIPIVYHAPAPQDIPDPLLRLERTDLPPEPDRGQSEHELQVVSGEGLGREVALLGLLWLQLFKSVLFHDEGIDFWLRVVAGDAGEEDVVASRGVDGDGVELFGEGMLYFVIVFIGEVNEFVLPCVHSIMILGNVYKNSLILGVEAK